MRLKIIFVFIFLALASGACGISIPILEGGPNLPTVPSQTEVTAPTDTLSPTDTSAPTDLPTLPPTDTASPDATLASAPVEEQAAPADYPFVLQTGSPTYLPAFTHPEAGCAWVGVAGQVFDEQQQPLEGVVILVKGYYNGKIVDTMVLSGLGEAYGPGGFEVQVGDQSDETNNAVTLQLVNQQFEPLSEPYPVVTYDDCQKNLVMVNFVAKTNSWKIFFPSIVD